jgi:uncharacterized glyoxalase superfamily protein PhnB
MSSAKPGFNHCTPIFCVTDLTHSLEHYRDVLGFEIAWQWSDDQAFEGGSPTFACVCRGEVSIFLGHQRQGSPGAWVSLHLPHPDDVDRVHTEYLASGARVVEPPSDRSWGLREMWVEDLDGNTFRIGSQLTT